MFKTSLIRSYRAPSTQRNPDCPYCVRAMANQETEQYLSKDRCPFCSYRLECILAGQVALAKTPRVMNRLIGEATESLNKSLNR